MHATVRVDKKGRILLPAGFRRALGIGEGEELLIYMQGDKIIVEKAGDPFKVLEEILGRLTFERSLRRMAEEEALKVVREGYGDDDSKGSA